jgi:8-oxo-dGTP pyrophosphatase MutT (NUDIX family)
MKIDNSWFVKPTGFKDRVASGGVVTRKTGNKIEVLLTTDLKRNSWVLPKGGVEKGETLLQAAIREILEETGATGLKKLTKLGVKERQTFEKNYWAIIHYYLFLTDKEPGKPTDVENDYYVEWFPIDNLPDIFWPEQKELIIENREKIVKLLEKY